MNSERPDALLTTTHRAFLAGDTDYDMTDSGGRTTRSRMRARLQEGLQDFVHLANPDEFSDRDVELLRESLVAERKLDVTLREMVAFIYRMDPDGFESIVEDGARLGVNRYNTAYEVGDVTIPILKQGQLLRQARRKMDGDEPLTDREIRAVLSDGEISPADLKDYVRSHPPPEVNDWGRRFR